VRRCGGELWWSVRGVVCALEVVRAQSGPCERRSVRKWGLVRGSVRMWGVVSDLSWLWDES
jgi:hypothetical protein